MALIFVAAAMPHEPGRVGVQILFEGGSYIVRPTIEQAYEWLGELSAAIAEAQKLAEAAA